MPVTQVFYDASSLDVHLAAAAIDIDNMQRVGAHETRPGFAELKSALVQLADDLDTFRASASQLADQARAADKGE
jgi:hypothetical protein